MKIIKIETSDNNIFKVTFKPNFIERCLGLVEKTVKYKDSGYIFKFGGGTVYYCENGKELDYWDKIGNKIDEFRRKF